MIKLLDILNEAKQVGILYHYTENWLLKQIIESNTLLAPVSFTRSKDKKTVSWINVEAALVIDGDKLSTKYKINIVILPDPTYEPPKKPVRNYFFKIEF